MRKTALLISFLAITSQAGLYLEGNFQVTDPKGEFGDALGHAILGGNIGGGWFFKPAPVALGADLGFFSMGKQTSTHNLLATSDLVTIDQTIQSSGVMGHLVLRVKPLKGIVRPYADGLFGFKAFSTETSVINSKQDTIATSKNLSDNTISYGVRGGVEIHPKKKSPLGINLGCQYLWGGEAQYLDASNSTSVMYTPPNHYILNPLKSRTDMLTVSIGVVVDMK